MSVYSEEAAADERFAFGENWRRFLSLLNESRLTAAEASLKAMLEVDDLQGRSFLDAGSGSGLFSLAARRLGARVHSFDLDPEAVACAKTLRDRYFPDDGCWRIEQGSVLDTEYLQRLGTFDVVYSWGVLHHTGQMWRALANVPELVAPSGKLFIAIYNDVGSLSSRWKWVKQTYNRLPTTFRLPFALLVIAPDESKRFLRSLLSLRPADYVQSWQEYGRQRGMSRWHDIIDWVGGYPYEVATPEAIFDFYRARGFVLTRLKCGHVGTGCNEFVFTRSDSREH